MDNIMEANDMHNATEMTVRNARTRYEESVMRYIEKEVMKQISRASCKGKYKVKIIPLFHQKDKPYIIQVLSNKGYGIFLGKHSIDVNW